ncbi:DoxX family membrane protein [Primorskyibacter flagellatus]|uniref:DoxX family membrane protein n=1 Tax=Primorskyibacter flagellatus TaxID=1387277 RepID=UPI003A91297C
MNTLMTLHNQVFERVERLDGLLPLLARFLFAAILLPYFWASAATKLGDGLFGFLFPASGAYAQIFPKAFEAANYNTDNLGVFHWLVVVAGTWAELLLPLLIVLGLATRLAALGMIGFIAVQSLTDLYGHGGIAHEGTLGAWFDRAPDALILDQRALWTFLLVLLIIKGAGLLSVDRALFRLGPWTPANA